MKAVIELENISFNYGEEPVLKGINLSVQQGEYYGIIGPNGAGKSTLLKIILGLFRPASGEVRLFGKALKNFREWPRLGYLPQKITQADARFPITVYEVVSQGRFARSGLFKKLSSSDHKAIVHSLEISDIAHLKRRLISDLSGGERQRVFFARALASEPELLILDEPATGIDVASQSKFYRFLRDLNKHHGITIIFVSHDVDVIANEASKLVCINRSMVCDGAANLVFKKNDNLLENLYGKNIKDLLGHD